MSRGAQTYRAERKRIAKERGQRWSDVPSYNVTIGKNIRIKHIKISPGGKKEDGTSPLR